jgi:hypothetical protein
MGIWSWLFPSEEDRLRKARDLMVRGLYEQARREVVGCKSAEGAALYDECSAVIAEAKAPSSTADGTAPSGPDRTKRTQSKRPPASVSSSPLPKPPDDAAILDELPGYSALRGRPSRGLPTDFAPEAGLDARSEALVEPLLEKHRREGEAKPLFVELIAGKGVVTFPLPDGGQCLPIFTSTVRAADYARTLLPKQHVGYLTTTPQQLRRMLRDLHEVVGSFTLDRCPRCGKFAVFANDLTRTADDAVQLWAIVKAGQVARQDAFVAYAVQAARAGRLEAARDVALQAAAHVTLEDPRIHLLLGQLALGLGDEVLLREAKAFLAVLGLEEWERQLDSDVKAGSPDFGDPAR